jgi:hypothetical protein
MEFRTLTDTFRRQTSLAECDIRRSEKKGFMPSFSSTRALPFLLLGSLSLSCICSLNFTFSDKSPQKDAATKSLGGAVAQTQALLETLMGEPYLVATFPSGAEIYLLAPQEDDVVTNPWVDVIGKAPAETVITLNEEIAVAGPDSMFYARVPLEEGLNEVLCVASDWEGNEVDFSIMVVYETEEG